MPEPSIFLGPPGTGKTTTLLDTVLQEMENGVPPDRIGFMTFTKKGVEEAISRASTRFNLPRTTFRYFNTLHSAAFRHLGLSTTQVFTGKRVREFGEAFGYELHGGQSSDDGTYTSFYGDDLILFLENLSRITLTPLEIIIHQNDFILPDAERSWKVVKDYRNHKQENGLFDFTDMIEQFIKSDDPPRLEVLLIDEAQDLSELQWTMVEQLSRHVKRLYIAGDDDQTIFTWAGASERFINMPGSVKLLEQSYRVPMDVHALADKIIHKVINRRDKIWMPREAEGSYSTLDDMSRLNPNFINTQDSVMMLGRTTKLLRKKFLPYCRYHGLLYRHFENNSIKPSVAKAIDSWCKLQIGMSIPATHALSIFNLLPSEGHGKKPGVKHGYKTQLKNIADQEDPPHFNMQDLKHDYGLLAEGPWEDLFVQITPEDKKYIQKVLANGFSLLDNPKIHISTVHRVKGGQANTVVLLSDTAKASEHFASNPDEEIRVFYTAITRTFQDLIIVQPEKQHHFSGFFE
jgi:superfamily I DNA/RNA helicase